MAMYQVSGNVRMVVEAKNNGKAVEAVIRMIEKAAMGDLHVEEVEEVSADVLKEVKDVYN